MRLDSEASDFTEKPGGFCGKHVNFTKWCFTTILIVVNHGIIWINMV